MSDALPLPPESDGTPRRLRRADDGRLVLVRGQQEQELAAGAIEAIFTRYGRALDPAVVVDAGGLALDHGARLVALAFRSPVDVLENHYFVMASAATPPLAVPTPLFVAALAALARP